MLLGSRVGHAARRLLFGIRQSTDGGPYTACKAQARQIVTRAPPSASSAEDDTPHPEIPGSDLSPSPQMPQPPVKVALQETSQPQPVDSEKGSEDREMMTPNRPDLPEDQLEPAESPQQATAYRGTQPQHQMPGVPGDLIPPGVPPQVPPPATDTAQSSGNSAQASDDAGSAAFGHGYWAGRVPAASAVNGREH